MRQLFVSRGRTFVLLGPGCLVPKETGRHL
jgi:hypothetical protein